MSTPTPTNVDIADLQKVAEQLREKTQTLETINQIGQLLSAELDLQKLVQAVTDAATELIGAQFGAFFYNRIDERGESYTLYTISGVPRELFSHFPMPRNTQLFGPTFRGEEIIRLDNVRADARYGQNAPYFGMPPGHLPVTSYLAVPVVSRSGEVLGGLFFGHAEAAVFTEHHEQIVVGLAAQTAIAMDNARLFEAIERERANAEAAERRFRNLVNGLDVIVWEANVPQRCFTFVSDQAKTITGYPPEQWLRIPDFWSQIIWADDRAQVLNQWEQAVQNKQSYDYEYRITTADGRICWMRDVGMVRADAGGVCAQGLMIDITKRKQAEIGQKRHTRQIALLADIGIALTKAGSLRELLDRCAWALVQHLNVAFARVWTLNEATNALELQASAGMYTHIDGAHSHIPVGKFKIGLIAQERRPHLTNDVVNDPRVSNPEWAKREGMVAFAGYPLLMEDRLIGVMALFSRETLDDDTIDALAAVSDSVTQVIERKRIDEERIRLLELEQVARTRAEELQKRFALLAEMSAVLAASLDYETTLRNVAQLTVPTLADWCAVDMREEDGTIARLVIVHSDPAKVHLAYELYRRYPPDPDAPLGVPYVIRTGQPVLVHDIPDSLLAANAQDDEHLEILRQLGLISYLIVPLRSREQVLGAITMVFAESGRRYDQDALALAQELARRAATAVDNARLYRAAQQLNDELELRVQERTAALETALKELDSFSYSVSHDLRAPLRSMDGFSLALLEDYGDQLDQEAQDFLRRIRVASQRMDRLIDNLLQLSRVSRRELVNQPVHLSELAHTIAEALQQEEPERQATFTIADDLIVSGDRSLLAVALENLFRNAWKFTAKRPEALIAFGVTMQQGQTVYFVRDNGVGFDMAYVDKLFNPFQRLHSEQDFPGTGIGLATVQRIMHRHGGRIWAEGAVDQGATFYFTL